MVVMFGNNIFNQYLSDKTKLKYIGEDGSLGLIRNNIYYVDIFVRYGKIVVKWGDNSFCPYDSLQSLCRNWQ